MVAIGVKVDGSSLFDGYFIEISIGVADPHGEPVGGAIAPVGFLLDKLKVFKLF